MEKSKIEQAAREWYCKDQFIDGMDLQTLGEGDRAIIGMLVRHYLHMQSTHGQALTDEEAAKLVWDRWPRVGSDPENKAMALQFMDFRHGAMQMFGLLRDHGYLSPAPQAYQLIKGQYDKLYERQQNGGTTFVVIDDKDVRLWKGAIVIGNMKLPEFKERCEGMHLSWLAPSTDLPSRDAIPIGQSVRIVRQWLIDRDLAMNQGRNTFDMLKARMEGYLRSAREEAADDAAAKAQQGGAPKPADR